MSSLLGQPPQQRPRRSLVLAGGGMRVAWQAGVVAALADAGLQFCHVDGTSGGTMTAGMLLSGLQPPEMIRRWSTLDVKDFSAMLPFREFVRGPAQWPGLGDSTGIRDKVLPHLGVDPAAIREASAREPVVGTINVCDFTSKECVAVASSDIDLDVLVAALSLPMLMPGVRTRGTVYTDAVWIKDANIIEALRRGATEIWLVWCIGNTPRYGDGAFEQYVHMIEMSANGKLNAELEVMADINARRLAGEPVWGTTTPTILHVIKPVVPIPLDPEFLTGRITADTLIDMGHRDACAYLCDLDPDGVTLSSEATRMTEPPLGVRLTERGHGTLGDLGDVTLELVTEIRDTTSFLADPAVAVPVVGHVDRVGKDRLLAAGGSFRMTENEMIYEIRFSDVAPLTSLLCRRRVDGLAGTVHGMSLEVETGGDHRQPLGTLHSGFGDARHFFTSIEPSGAHDLEDRAEAVDAVARLLKHGL